MNQELINKIKNKGYINHISEKYGVDLSKVNLIQDIIIEEITLGIKRELEYLHKQSLVTQDLQFIIEDELKKFD